MRGYFFLSLYVLQFACQFQFFPFSDCSCNWTFFGFYRTVCFIYRVACEFCDEAGHEDVVSKLEEVINLRFQYWIKEVALLLSFSLIDIIVYVVHFIGLVFLLWLSLKYHEIFIISTFLRSSVFFKMLAQILQLLDRHLLKGI